MIPKHLKINKRKLNHPKRTSSVLIWTWNQVCDARLHHLSVSVAYKLKTLKMFEPTEHGERGFLLWCQAIFGLKLLLLNSGLLQDLPRQTLVYVLVFVFCPAVSALHPASGWHRVRLEDLLGQRHRCSVLALSFPLLHFGHICCFC